MMSGQCSSIIDIISWSMISLDLFNYIVYKIIQNLFAKMFYQSTGFLSCLHFISILYHRMLSISNLSIM